ncbi:MAG: DUF445 family protein [Desulfitobacteriaceae bacterium]
MQVKLRRQENQESGISKSNYRLANLTLSLVTVGLFLSYPFRDNFWGGLAFSAFSAGVVAGLADWFAVTALFRKPLGIRPGKILRTEIIPRNRERLFTALADMVEKDLLSKDALKQRLKQYDSAAFLLSYLAQPNVQDELTEFLSTLLSNLPHTGPRTIVNYLKEFIQESTVLVNLSPLFIETFESSRQQGHFAKVFSFLAREVRTLAVLPELKEVLSSWLHEAYRTYEQNNTTRKLINSFLPSPEELAGDLQEHINDFVSGPRLVNTLETWLEDYWVRLKTSPDFKLKIEQLAIKFLQSLGLEEFLTTELPIASDRLKLVIRDLLGQLLLTLQTNTSRQKKLDDLLKTGLIQFIDAQHAAIGRMVRDSLEVLTNSKLVELVESKAGNDLQMIRINGSVVGSIAGMLIYLVNFLIQ